METLAHQRLKRLALLFLRASGCVVATTEVRCPISRFRVDAAGWQDAVPRTPQPDEADDLAERRTSRWRLKPRTIVIECKQSRADFVRDNRALPALLDRRRHLERIREAIEHQRIVPEEPHLRRSGASLFPELDEWDFHASRLPAYRRILATLRRLDQKIHGETKLHLMARYQLADRLYLAAPAGMIHPAELPTGWGLLECPARALEAEADGQRLPALGVRVPAACHSASERCRARLLRNIAAAACLRVTSSGENVLSQAAQQSQCEQSPRAGRRDH